MQRLRRDRQTDGLRQMERYCMLCMHYQRWQPSALMKLIRMETQSSPVRLNSNWFQWDPRRYLSCRNTVKINPYIIYEAPYTDKKNCCFGRTCTHFGIKVKWTTSCFYLPITAQRCRSKTENSILDDLFSAVLSLFKKYHPSRNLKFN